MKIELKPSVHNQLYRLLDLNQEFELHAVGTTNHCPMALIALARMGASANRLQDFFDQWTKKYAIKRLALAEPAPVVTHWSLFLNQD